MGEATGHRHSGSALAGLLAAAAVFCGPGVAFACGPAESAREDYVIDAVVIEGLERTRREVVEDALQIEAGGRIDSAGLDRGVRRVRELGIFHQTRCELLDQRVPLPDEPQEDSPHRVLHIRVDERWTLMPLFSVNRGGDLSSLSAGLWDTNAFGRHVELGGRYRRLEQTNSVVAWGHVPRFVMGDVSASLELGWTNRPRVLYSPNGEVEGGYLRRRRYVGAAAAYHWSRHLSTGFGVDARVDDFSLDLIPQEAAESQRAVGLPRENRTIAPNASLRLGRIETEDFRRRGLEYRHRVALSEPALGSQRRFLKTDGRLRFFVNLPLRSNLAARAHYAISGAKDIEELYFLGGLSQVRGFVDSRFRGSQFWLANVELRVPSITADWFVLQHVGFFDSAGVGQSIGELWGVSGATAGVGARIILPMIRGLMFRFDYGWPVVNTGRASFSFGTTQYF